MVETPTATVSFARLGSRGLLLGLTGGQLGLLAVALIVAVLAQYTTGVVGLLMTAPIWATAALAAVVMVAGRPVMAWAPIRAGWWLRQLIGRTTHLTDPAVAVAGVGAGAGEDFTVPGLPDLTLTTTPTTGTAVVCEPGTDTLVVALAVQGSALVLAEYGDQQHRIAGWGRVLAGLCQRPGLLRAQVLVRTRPGGATGVRTWWAAHALPEDCWAARLVADLIAHDDATGARTETLLAVAIRPPHGLRGSHLPTALGELEAQLVSLADAVRAADLDPVGWLTSPALRAALRAGFDPCSPGGRTDAGTAPAVAVAVTEGWDHLVTDSAAHAVFWVREWPRSEVPVDFLAPLILGGAHRTLSLTCEPVSVARALRDIRRAKVEAASDAAARTRIGQVEDQTLRAQAQDIERREADLVAGHAELRFTALLTVTAPTEAELAGACTATESAAAQAMCELRRLVGQQATAFTAGALPLARSTT